jgi:hypothetical protein
LHKISSNSDVVLSAFATEDLSKDFKDLELGKECLPDGDGELPKNMHSHLIVN